MRVQVVISVFKQFEGFVVGPQIAAQLMNRKIPYIHPLFTR